MKTNRLVWILTVSAVALFIGCSDDDDSAKPDTNMGKQDGSVSDTTQASEQGTGGQEAGASSDSGTSLESMVGKSCTNADHNTHTDCTGDTNYCVPAINGVEASGLTQLTCTKADCDTKDPASCPGTLVCKEIPEFVLNMMKGQGVNMPATICGK